MPLAIGDEVPDIQLNTTQGTINFREFCTGGWSILFSHPRDYTPVCTTELGEVARLTPELEKRGVKVLALSCDTVESHNGWIKDIEASRGVTVTYPIVADPDRVVASRLGMLDPDEKDLMQVPVTVRGLYVIGPDAKAKLGILYPPSVGRNFKEVLRVVDALQVAAKYPIATPANWTNGDKVMIQPCVSAEEAKTKFPDAETESVPSGKAYMRYTKDPSSA